MTKRLLQNELNVKDENRLANATSKLTADTPATPYNFDDTVYPCMVAGIEENQTDSTVDLITCIRDVNGVNRLTVDSIGLPAPSKNQNIFNIGYLNANPIADYPIFQNTSQKILNITGVTYSNNSSIQGAFAWLEQYFISIDDGTFTGNQTQAVISINPQTTTTLTGNILFQVLPKMYVQVHSTAQKDNLGIYVWGYYQ
jgi:hypothetical protein